MVILHILALYAALWVFVKVHSAAIDSLDPDAALRRVKSYSAYFSDRGRRFQRDRGRRFTVIVDGRGCAQATGFIVTQSSMMA